MNASPASTPQALGPYEQFRYGREVLQVEGEALVALAKRLEQKEFCRAVELICDCQGSVIVSGMGKAGLVGQKIVATLASTGTPSHFLHPGEAIHGDLGRIQACDVVLMLSFSGETEEVVRLLPSLAEMGAKVIAVTGKAESTLARGAEVTLDLGPIREACSLGLAPSTSTTAMMAMGDALALVVSRVRQFGAEDFARFHPGGSLGRKLAKVDEFMRPLAQCRVSQQTQSVREVFVGLSRPGRRSGAIMVTDFEGTLRGIFTDSDLARLLEANRDDAFDGPLADVMTRSPKSVTASSPLSQSVDILAGGKISELPVVDAAGKPVGMIDITDVVGLLPREDLPAQSSKSIVTPPASTGFNDSNTVPFRTKQ